MQPDLRCGERAVWALFRNGVAAGSEGYDVFRSLDAGKTWTAVLANLDQHRSRLPRISNYADEFVAVGSRSAVFVGTCPACGRRQPTITVVATRDGGHTWSRHTVLDGYWPEAVSFVDARRGWLLTSPARDAPSGGWIWATRDAGRTWRVVFRSPALATSP
jgi:photosystem II stability/assembly factor-like uncharacterized protein